METVHLHHFLSMLVSLPPFPPSPSLSSLPFLPPSPLSSHPPLSPSPPTLPSHPLLLFVWQCYNKIDQISIEEVDRLARQPNSVVVRSAYEIELY